MKSILASGAIIAAASLSTGQIFVDDQAGWESAAIGPITAPDYSLFAAQDFNPGSNNFNGLFDVNAVGGGVGAADFNSVGNFVFDFDPAGLQSVTITFNEEITGFAAVWSNTFVQDGFRVSTPFNDYDLNVLSDPLGATFIGFQEASGFNSITFTTTNNIPGDDFVFFSNLQWSAVPAPGAASLLAVAGLAAARRRR